MRVIVSCEHATKHIPAEYRGAFKSQQARRALNSHRGVDFGARELAVDIAGALKAPVRFAKASRLLIDLNRSEHHPDLFSEFSRKLSREQRDNVLAKLYRPYRRSIERLVERQPTLHLSIHSFTPKLRGQVRNADVGLLYDPNRQRERQLCARLKRELHALDPLLRVRFNYPYRGMADGLTTALRKRFKPSQYFGIELEINQAHLALGDVLVAALKHVD